MLDEPSTTELKAKFQTIVGDTTEEMLTPLLDALAKLEFSIRKPPSTGLLMINIGETKGTVFHLGEVLVTQTEIQHHGQTGFGCCIGDRPEAALALASLDALGQIAGGSADMDPIDREIERLCRAVAQRRETESRMAALTQVEFKSMAEE